MPSVHLQQSAKLCKPFIWRPICWNCKTIGFMLIIDN
jgi:hypothetical protein